MLLVFTGCSKKENNSIQNDESQETTTIVKIEELSVDPIVSAVNYSGNTTYNMPEPDYLFNIQALCNVNIRDGHTTSNIKISRVDTGDILRVYETIEDGGYTWYKISYYGQAWVADDSTFFKRIDKSANNEV